MCNFSGRSVFTTRLFQKDDFLLRYAGELIDKKEADQRDYIFETGFRYVFDWKGKKLW